MRSLIRLILWGAMWLIAWLIVEIVRTLKKKPRLDNCLTWALRRWDEEGGYLVVRWARSARWHWLRWPHFLWLDEKHHQELKHFLPRDNTNEMHFLPDPWFHGRVQKGDPPETLEN